MVQLIAIAPLALLLITLLLGRYVGEERIARLAARFRPPRRRPSAPPLSSSRATACALPRGGRLIAASLAQRGPPAVLVVP
ncbi:MAG: hypothetical protein ACXVFN_16450 [Solirubrobacteraceae bacterium]